MQLGGKMGAEKHDQIGRVYPGKQGNDHSHPPIDPLVIKQGHKLPENETADFPQNGGNQCGRKSLPPKYFTVRGPLEDKCENEHRYQQSCPEQKERCEPAAARARAAPTNTVMTAEMSRLKPAIAISAMLRKRLSQKVL